MLFSLCRHKRTHDRNDGAEGNFHSGEEEEQYSGEDNSLGESSPTSENGYVPGSLDAAVHGHGHGHGGIPTSGLAQAPQQQQYNSLQTLSMPMTISQPHAINTGGLA